MARFSVVGMMRAEILKLIQILMVEAVEDFARDGRVQRAEIADHSGLRRNGAADGDLEKIVVAVAVGMIALAVGLAVGGFAERRIVQPVRGGQTDSGG